MSSSLQPSVPSSGSSGFPPFQSSPSESQPSPKDSGTAEAISVNEPSKTRIALNELEKHPQGGRHSPSTVSSSPDSRRYGKQASHTSTRLRSGGFLLEPGPLQVSKRRHHDQTRSEQRSDGNNRTVDRRDSAKRTSSNWPHEGQNEELSPSNRSHSTNIDASDIVRMALSLSEGRKTSQEQGNAPPGLESSARRNISAALAPSAPMSAASGANHIGSLWDFLGTPQSPQSTGRSSSPHSSKTPHSLGAHLDNGFVHHFSPATLARAEKARNFLELQAEHRRALEYLPPLHPSRSRDGKSSERNQTNGQSAGLGRQYNPLQFLRNKRVRMREQMVLDSRAMGWNDTYNVKSWVDSLEQRAKTSGFVDGDIVHLPHPSASQLGQISSLGPLLDQPATDPFAQKTSRPKFDWSVTPEALFSDIYWMEQDSHKEHIESRTGDKVFWSFQRPERAQWSHSGERKLLDRTKSVSSKASTVSDDHRNYFSLSTSKTKTNDSSHTANLMNVRSIGYSKNAAAKVGRRLLRRRTASSSSSENSAAELEHGPRASLNRTRSSTAENIGPLERHMKQIQDAESSARQSLDINTTKLRPTFSRQGSRRGGFSEDNYKPEAVGKEINDFEKLSMHSSNPSTVDLDGPPRISVDNYDEGRVISDNILEPIKTKGLGDLVKRRTRVPKLGFLRRGVSKADNSIDENDFAILKNDVPKDQTNQLHYSPPSSASSPSKSNSYTNLAKLPSIVSRSRPGSQDHTAVPSKRIFKGGRLGQLIRDEMPRSSDKGSRAATPRKMSKASLQSAGSSDTEEEIDPLMFKNEPQRLRSLSSGDLSRIDNFHIKNLPTFRSANAPEPPTTLPTTVLEDTAEVDEDAGRAKVQARGEQRRKSRFQRLRDTTPDSSDVSPNTSTLDVRQPRKSHRRSATADAVGSSRSRDHSADQSISRSRSRVRAADTRLNAFLDAPGNISRMAPPATGLSRIKAKKDDPRSWSIANATKTSTPTPTFVTRKEISYARCHLLSTGIMAKGIIQRANQVRTPIPDFLVQAGLAAGTDLTTVVRRLEYATAANLFSKSLEKTVGVFEESAQDFRQKTCNKLHSRIDDLRDKVTPTLSPAVQSCSDSADAFIAELTTTKTMAVKQVNDAVDLMLRSRRRRLRFLKKGGFALLEWILVGLMWWIWLFVFLIRACRGVIIGTFRGVRWLLWL